MLERSRKQRLAGTFRHRVKRPTTCSGSRQPLHRNIFTTPLTNPSSLLRRCDGRMWTPFDRSPARAQATCQRDFRVSERVHPQLPVRRGRIPGQFILPGANKSADSNNAVILRTPNGSLARFVTGSLQGWSWRRKNPPVEASRYGAGRGHLQTPRDIADVYCLSHLLGGVENSPNQTTDSEIVHFSLGKYLERVWICFLHTRTRTIRMIFHC